MKTNVLLKKLSYFFPKKISRKYNDFSGLQVGKLKENTNNILLCLDFDRDVYNYILNNNLVSKIDLIITHHPFIYGTYKKVIKNDKEKFDLVNKLNKLSIPVYSYHTNFDEGKFGMNDALCEIIGLTNIKPLLKDPMARGGELKEKEEIYHFSKFIKEVFKLDYCFLINEGKKFVKKIAIVGGGGWRTFKIAKEEDYDLFISGDMPHHGRREVVALKYNYLEVPHEIEKIFMYQMSKILKTFDINFNIIIVDHEKLPILI